MLGMMNSPSDSVEFYATNRKVSDDAAMEGVNSDLHKFSEIKQKDVVSYTEGASWRGFGVDANVSALTQSQ